MSVRNITIVFLVSGLWHGANWTFIVWGALHAAYYLPLFLFEKNRDNTGDNASDTLLPGFREGIQILSTFTLTTLAWVFFRADTVSEAFEILQSIFSASLFTFPEVRPLYFLGLLLVFIVIEWLGRHNNYAIEKTMDVFPRVFRWAFYYGVIWMLFSTENVEQDFIYFQF